MKHIHGGNIQEAIEKYNLKEEDIIDFSANINFLGPAAELIFKLKDNLDKISRYPEANSLKLKNHLANYLNLNKENIVIGNGAAELIYQLVGTLSPQSALILAPTFSEYELAILAKGGKVNHLPLKRERDFKVDVEDFINKLAKVGIAFICNPNNPSGDLTERSQLIEIIEYANKNKVMIVIDEAFIDFVIDEKNYTVYDLVKKYNNLFVLRSLTKFYAIPGLRLGYGIGKKDLIESIESKREPWSVNIMAQLAGEIILKAEEFRQKTKELTLKEGTFLYQELKKIRGFKPFKVNANFIFVDIKDYKYKSTILTKKLAEKAILIRDCSSYHNLGQDYIRLAVKNREDNVSLLNTLNSL